MPWYFETMCLHSVPSRMKWHDTVLCCTVGCGVCPHVITILCYCVIVLCCVIVLYSWVWVCVSTCYHHIYDRGDKKMTEAGASSQHGPSALALTHTNVPNVIYKHHWKKPKPHSMHVTHLWVSMKVAYSGLSNTHRSWSLLFSLPCGDFYSVAS